MKKKMLRSIWLRICMIVAVVTTAFAGTAWAEIHPIDVEVEGFTATSGNIDGNISYSTTNGNASNSNLSANTIKLTAANGAKINSVTFHWTTSSVSVTWTATNKNKNGTFVGQSTGGTYAQEYPQVTDLECETISFSNEWNSLKIDYISVTYTPGTPEYTITALSSDTNKGTVEVDGNVIIAHPNHGYGVDDTNPYTVTEGPDNIIQTGNYFAVVPPTACSVTINFVAHAGGSSLDFEHPLNSYNDWNIQGIEQYSNWPYAHGGTRFGRTTANTASIQTTAKIEYPGTLSFYFCPINYVGSPVTWKVQVLSSDESTWRDVGELSYTTADGSEYKNEKWYPFSFDLSSKTDVYVRLVYNGGGKVAGIDDIVLTEETATVPVSVSSYGYSTFCSHRALDFTNSSINVYYATAEGKELTFHKITKLPADTGVLLQKVGNGIDPYEEEVPALVGTPDAVTGNVFVPGAGAAVSYSDEDQNYILYHGEILKAKNNNVATSRAYIHLPNGNGVKDFSINLEADVTGIETIDDAQSTMNDAIYNLAGQRLKKMQKGINIVNGKKMIQR